MCECVYIACWVRVHHEIDYVLRWRWSVHTECDGQESSTALCISHYGHCELSLTQCLLYNCRKDCAHT